MGRLARAIAQWRGGLISPNAISVFGLMSACAAGALLFATSRFESQPSGWLLGVLNPRSVAFILVSVLIALRLFCNMLDGLVAVEGRRGTPTGPLFNEVPDRFADAAILIGAGYAWGSSPSLGWLAAISAIFVAYIRVVGRSLSQTSDFRGPMAKQQRMALVIVASLATAILPAGSFFSASRPERFSSGYSFMALALGLVIVGCAITFVRRWRGVVAGLRAGKPDR